MIDWGPKSNPIRTSNGSTLWQKNGDGGSMNKPCKLIRAEYVQVGFEVCPISLLTHTHHMHYDFLDVGHPGATIHFGGFITNPKIFTTWPGSSSTFNWLVWEYVHQIWENLLDLHQSLWDTQNFGRSNWRPSTQWIGTLAPAFQCPRWC